MENVSGSIDAVCVKFVNGEEILALRYLDEFGEVVDCSDVFDMLTDEEAEELGMDEDEFEETRDSLEGVFEFVYPLQVINVNVYNERTQRAEVRTTIVKYLPFSDDDSVCISAENIMTINSMNQNTYTDYQSLIDHYYDLGKETIH